MRKTLLVAALAVAALHSPLRAEDDLAAQIKALRADVDMMKSTHAQDRRAAGLNLWVQATGYYSNVVAAGDDLAGVSKNRGKASSILDIGADGKPAEGLEASAVLRLDANGIPTAWDIWAQQELPWGLSLRAGFLDLTGIFDASAIANDEKAQFIRAEFVDSLALGNGVNATALRLHWQATEHAYVQAAVQDYAALAVDPFDDLFTIIETGCHHDYFGGQDAKLWYRETGRGQKGAVTALGAVLDQNLPGGVKAFGRWAREFKATGLEHDPYDPGLGYIPAPLNGGAAFETASLGLEWTGPCKARPEDRVGAAWGTLRADDTFSRDFAELYYAYVINHNALVSLHYSADFSQLVMATPQGTYEAADNEHKLLGRVNLSY